MYTKRKIKCCCCLLICYLFDYNGKEMLEAKHFLEGSSGGNNIISGMFVWEVFLIPSSIFIIEETQN